MNKGTAKFGVFHDILKASDMKIRHSGCLFYQRHDPSATSTEWYYFDDLKSATKKASELAKKHNTSYGDCKFCKPGSLINS